LLYEGAGSDEGAGSNEGAGSHQGIFHTDTSQQLAGFAAFYHSEANSVGFVFHIRFLGLESELCLIVQVPPSFGENKLARTGLA
jgi:hypothetical protein